MFECTPRDTISERKALVICPMKTCQPVGALYAALGVNRTMPHSHGSQGCVSFHRMFLTRHFKEPAIASTSAFTEGASVFGGGANLKTAVRNIFDIYDPDIIAIHTTCLSETIGDDLHTFVSQLEIPEGKRVIYASTPSYVGSHITGFSSMSAAFIELLAEKPELPTSSGLSSATAESTPAEIAGEQASVLEPPAHLYINPGFVNPGDMREIKRILGLFGIDFTMMPDTSGVLDAPMTGEYRLYPQGGTPLASVVALGRATYALALGALAGEASMNALYKKFGCDYTVLNTPIGVAETDTLVMELARFAQSTVPQSIEEERGQLIDCMLDAHQYLDNKRIAICGDPDIVVALTAFALECGMHPTVVATGTPSKEFAAQVALKLELAGFDPADSWIKAEADFFELHQRIIHTPVDLIIGPSTAKQVARAEDVPLVRVGIPVLDRYVHPQMPIVGYRGSLRVLELMLTALMDRIERDASDTDFEFIM